MEKAKRALSSQHQARVEVESFFDGDDFSETLTRARFEELNMVCPSNTLSLSSCTIFSMLSAVFETVDVTHTYKTIYILRSKIVC